jgi:3-oxoadipate enol-lactonase
MITLASGATIHADQTGSGPPIVLVAGLGDDHTLWDPLVPSLTRDHRCLTFDNRGAGRSSAPQPPHEIATWAQDARDTAQALGATPAVIIGCSMGGAIVQEWVLRHPDDAIALVLISTWARTDDTISRTLREWIRLAAIGDLGTLTQSMLAACLDDPLATSVNEAPPDRDGFIAQATACMHHDTQDRLGEIAVPTLVIAGTRDRLISPRNADELAARIPNAELARIDTGHVPFWERPAEVARLIATFADRHAPRRRAASRATGRNTF